MELLYSLYYTIQHVRTYIVSPEGVNNIRVIIILYIDRSLAGIGTVCTRKR